MELVSSAQFQQTLEEAMNTNPIALLFVGVGVFFSGCAPTERLCRGPILGECNPSPDVEKKPGESRPPKEEIPPDSPDELSCPFLQDQEVSLVFVTSERFKGDFALLEEADDICQRLADDAGLAGTYKAWINLDGWTPANRQEFCSVRNDTTRFERVDGKVLAVGWDNLTTKPLPVGVGMYYDEHGKPTSSTYIWADVTQDGWPADNRTCRNWTSHVSYDRGGKGATNAWSQWSDGGDVSCESDNHLLCFGVASIFLNKKP